MVTTETEGERERDDLSERERDETIQGTPDVNLPGAAPGAEADAGEDDDGETAPAKEA